MGIEILESEGGIEIFIFGVVTGKEVVCSRKNIYDDDNIKCRYRYYIFNNFECTEYDVTADDIALIAELDIQASKTNPQILMAIIESENLQFSLTEVWQAHVEEHISNIKSFADRQSAISWIQSNSGLIHQ